MILTLLTIQYLEYNRLRYLLCLQCKDLQYSVLTTLLLTTHTTMHYLQAVLISNCTSKPTFTKPNIHGKRTYILSVLKRQRLWSKKIQILLSLPILDLFLSLFPYLFKNWNVCYPLYQLWFLIGDIFTCRF